MTIFLGMKTCNKYIVENKHILFHKDKTIRNPSDTICWYQIFNKLTLIKYVLIVLILFQLQDLDFFLTKILTSLIHKSLFCINNYHFIMLNIKET